MIETSRKFYKAKINQKQIKQKKNQQIKRKKKTQYQIQNITNKDIELYQKKKEKQIVISSKKLSQAKEKYYIDLKKLWKKKKIQNCYCEVCFQSNSRYYPEGDEKGIKMMVCYGCSVKCHSYCYGIDTQSQEEYIKNKPEQKVIYFLCQKCRIEPKKQVSCVVCNQKKGALKRIENSQLNEWVHVTCGLYNGGIIKTENYKNMTFVKQQVDKPIEKDKKAKTTCHFCKSDIGIKKCLADECNQHTHIYCTMKYMHEQELKGVGFDDMEWLVRLYYVNNTHFDINKGESEASDLSKNVYFQESLKQSFNEISQILLGTSLYEVQNAIQQENTPCETKLNKLNSSSRKQKGKQKTSQDQIQDSTQDQNVTFEKSMKEMNGDNGIIKLNKIKYQNKIQEIGNLILKNLVINASNNKIQEEDGQVSLSVKKGKSTAQDNNSEQDPIDPEMVLRGGDVQVECPKHRRIEVYCVCQKVTEEEFVYCDLCGDWYHYSCIKFDKKKNDSEDAKYRCPLCDEWFNHKKKKLLKEFNSGKAENHDILIANMPKYNLMDYISIALFIDQRIQNILFSVKKGNIENQINDVVKNLSFIPIFSSKISDIIIFKQRKYLHQAINNFLQKIIEETDLFKLVSAIEIEENNQFKYNIIEENLSRNEELKRQIDEISALYQKNKMNEKGILFNLKKPINWIMKVHQTFIKKQEKISQLILNDLLKEDEEEIKNTQEYKLFDQIQSKLKSWNQKVLNLYESTISKAQVSMEEEQKNPISDDKQEVDEDDFITLKYKMWRDRLNTRPTITELESILDEGRNIPVDCSQEIKKLELEKEEIQIWCQILEEQERNATIILNQKLKQEERVNKNSHGHSNENQNESDGQLKLKKKDSLNNSSSKIEIEDKNIQDAIQIKEKDEVNQLHVNDQDKIKEEDSQMEEDKDDNKNKKINQEVISDDKIQKKSEQNSEKKNDDNKIINEENEKTKNEQADQQKMEQEDDKEQIQDRDETKGQEHIKNKQEGLGQDSNKSMEIEQEQKDVLEQKNSKELSISNETTKNHIEPEIQQKVYKNQQLMSRGDFEIFANQMLTKVVLQVPRMNEVINMMELYDRNELKWERIMDYINEREQEQAKQPEQQGENNIFFQQTQLQGIVLLIEYSELKEILDSSLKLEIKVPFLNQLVQQINMYLDIKDQYQAILQKQFDEKLYLQALKRISQIPFIIEEEKLLNERLLYFKEAQDFCINGFKKNYSVDQIQKLYDVSQQSKFPQDILDSLKEKIEPVIQIVNGINKIVESGEIEKEQIDQLKEYQNSTKNYKVDFRREMEIIKNIDKSEKWYRSLHKFLFNLTPEIIALDPSQRVQEIDLELEEILEAKTITECQQDIQEKWNLITSNTEQIKTELFGFIKEGYCCEVHFDKRINKTLSNLSELYWTHEALNIINKIDPQEIKFEQVYPIYQNAKNFKIQQDNEIYQKIDTLYQELYKRKLEEIELNNKKINESIRLKQQQQQEELLQQEKLKQQQLLGQGKKKINLVLSDSDEQDDDEDDDESDSYSSDEESDLDDEDDDDENSNNDDQNDNHNNNKNKDDNTSNNSDQDNSDNEDESDHDPDEGDVQNLSEPQKDQYKKLIEQGKKWNETTLQIYKQIKEAHKKALENKKSNVMEIEEDSFFITFQQLKNLLQEGYQIIFDILTLKKNVLFMRNVLNKLESVFEKINYQLQKVNKITDPDKIDDSIKVYNCIDISDILIEYKVNVSSNSNEKLNLQHMIKQPFQNLNKFLINYNKLSEISYFVKQDSHDNKQQQQQKKVSSSDQNQNKQQKQKPQKNQKQETKKNKMVDQNNVIELESQENNSENNNQSEKSNQITEQRQKSKRKKTKLYHSDFVYGADYMKQEKKDDNKNIDQKNKSKKQPEKSKEVSTSEPKKVIEEIQSDGDYESDSANLEHKAKVEFVTDKDRNEVKDKLNKVFMSNQIFTKSQNPIKTIENQLFGEYVKQRKKYLQKSEQYIKLFTEMNNFPNISKKVALKSFQIVTLDKLLTSNLEQVEKNIKLQQSQQQQQQQATNQQNQNQQQTQQQQNAQNPSTNPSSQTKTASSTSIQKMNSSKEPQVEKKVKIFDQIAKIPDFSQIATNPSNNQQQSSNNNMSALSLLIQKNDQYKGKDFNNNSKQNNQYSNSNFNQNKHQRDDYHNKRNNQGNKHQNYIPTNNRKRRNQAAFSDESDNEEIYDKKNNQAQQVSKDFDNQGYENKQRNKSVKEDSYSNRDDKLRMRNDQDLKKEMKSSPSSQGFGFSTSVSYNEDKINTPKQSINKQDCDEIDQIQSVYNSESKVYQFERAGMPTGNQQKVELLYNPDANDDGELPFEEEENIQQMNKQYFDKDDEFQIGLLSNNDNANSINSQSNNYTSSYLNQKVSSLNDRDFDNFSQPSNSQRDIREKRESIQSREGENEMEEEVDDEEVQPIPDDSILRICKCKIKPVKSHQHSVHAQLFTGESIKQLRKFPLIDTSKQFDLSSQTDFNQVKSYISKQLKNKSIIILKGWIELQNPKQDSDIFLNTIQQQDTKNKVTGFKISGVTFNLFTENQLNKTEFKFPIKQFNNDNQAVLPFIIYMKTNQPKPSQINQYEIVKFCQNPLLSQSLNEQKKYQNQQVVSPIISENEDEDDEGLRKRDSIFDEKYNDTNQQDSQPFKGLQDIDLQSIQQQLLDLPTTNEHEAQDDHKSNNSAAPLRSFQPNISHSTQPYENQQGNQFNNYQRQPHHPQPYGNNMHIPHVSHQHHIQNQNYGNNYGNFGLNQAPTPLPPPPSHQPHGPIGTHYGMPQNFGHNQGIGFIPPPPPPPPLPPTHQVQQHSNNSSQNQIQINTAEKTEVEKKINDLNEKKDNFSNDKQNNEEDDEQDFDIDLDNLDQIQNFLEQKPDEEAGHGSSQNIPPSPASGTAQAHQQYHVQQPNSYQGFNQPSNPQSNQNISGYHHPPPPQNQNEQNQGQSQQNQNIDNNLQQLLLSQRSKPVYDMNSAQGQGYQQQIPNYQNKSYLHQQPPNAIPPQISHNPNQMTQQPPQQIHGQNQRQQPWQQNPQQGNMHGGYNRQPPNKNQPYNMNNNQFNQKNMMNPPPLPGQAPNQPQNMPPGLTGYNNNNNNQMNRGYPPQNKQNNQNNNLNNMNINNNNINMNRQQRFQQNTQPYSGNHQQFSGNSPNNQNQQNFNKFQRGGNQNNNANKQQHGQFKNQFGSRQQAHYQRNNQPYTAHNPVPFIDPEDKFKNQQNPQQQQNPYQGDPNLDQINE